MTDISTYQGKVTEYKAPTGKGPHKFGIAQSKDGYEKTKKFRVWGTDYETKQPNPDVEMLQKAQLGGLEVSVSYYTKQGEYQGKTFPENYITAVEFVGGGDAPSVSEPPVNNFSGSLQPPSPQGPTTTVVAATTKTTLDLNVLRACLEDAIDALGHQRSAFADAIATIDELQRGAADAAPADDGW